MISRKMITSPTETLCACRYNVSMVKNLWRPQIRFVSASEAASSQLAYVDNQTNHAIIKVDNTSTVVWNYKRNSVRITSADLFPVGSVWVTDLYHIPYGVSLKIIDSERLAKHGPFVVLGLASLVVAITKLAHRRVSEIVIDFFLLRCLNLVVK